MKLQKKNLEEGEKNLLIAYEMGLPTDTEKATVLLQLGNLSYNKRKVPQARAYLKELRGLNVTEPIVLEQANQLEQALKMRPNMGNMMMMQGKGMKGAKAKMMRAQQSMIRNQRGMKGTKPRGGRKKGRKKK